jgi:threonine/homoserine/homoserine lactone efflux protein
MALLQNMNTCPGPGLILWYDLSNEKGTQDSVPGMLGALTTVARELKTSEFD